MYSSYSQYNILPPLEYAPKKIFAISMIFFKSFYSSFYLICT